MIKQAIGVEISNQDLANYYVSRLPKIANHPQGKLLIDAIFFYRSFIYKKSPPYPQAIEILNHLRQQGDLIWFVSGRPEKLREVTETWFKNNGLSWAVEEKRIILKPDEKVETYAFKREATKQLGLTVFIDDYPETVKLLDDLPHLPLAILAPQPWNKVSVFSSSRLFRPEENSSLSFWGQIDHYLCSRRNW